MAFNIQTFKSGELDYRVNLSKQIDRIADLFSKQIEATHLNIAEAQKMLIDTQTMSVEMLGYMLIPYMDDEYNGDAEKLKTDNGGKDKIREKQQYAMERYGLLMKLMNRKHLLIEEVEEEVSEKYPIDEQGEEDAN